MRNVLKEILIGVFIVTLFVLMITTIYWLHTEDLVYPADFDNATKLCEANEGWRSIELNSATTARTLTCNNGGVFEFEKVES